MAHGTAAALSRCVRAREAKSHRHWIRTEFSMKKCVRLLLLAFAITVAGCQSSSPASEASSKPLSFIGRWKAMIAEPDGETNVQMYILKDGNVIATVMDALGNAPVGTYTGTWQAIDAKTATSPHRRRLGWDLGIDRRRQSEDDGRRSELDAAAGGVVSRESGAGDAFRSYLSGGLTQKPLQFVRETV